TCVLISRTPSGDLVIGQQQCQLEPIGDAQLAKDFRQVRLDSPFAYIELLCDLLIGSAASHQRRDLAFAYRQIGKSAGDCALVVYCGRKLHTELVQQSRHQWSTNPKLTHLNSHDDTFQELRVDVIPTIPSHTGLEQS